MTHEAAAERPASPRARPAEGPPARNGESSGLRVGIDASNLRQGGGVTHLVELLSAADPTRDGFASVHVWAGRRTLEQLPKRPWLQAVHCRALDGSLLARLLWQRTALGALVTGASCDVLFAPGGSHSGRVRPVVTMSRNMLPFAPDEARRYGVSWTRVRLALLHRLQTTSLRSADGVIFLNATARAVVERSTGRLAGAVAVVPHGVSQRFAQRVAPHRSPRAAPESASPPPFRWLYVSIVDLYKHQWIVAEAAGSLRERWPVTLDFVGPAYPPAMRRLQEVRRRVAPDGEYIRYHSAVPHEALAQLYREADGFVFASTCENMPNILLEAAAAGLPIVCSDRLVMREVLGDAAVYCEPTDPRSVASAMRRVMESALLRSELASAAARQAREFTWARCARETFAFLDQVARRLPSARPAR